MSTKATKKKPSAARRPRAEAAKAPSKRKPKIQNIEVIGRRWFQKSYGNTYNTVQIRVNGDLVASLPKDYGYGEMYYQRAGQWLIENGWIKAKKSPHGGYPPLHVFRDQGKFKLNYYAIDVPREKDL